MNLNPAHAPLTLDHHRAVVTMNRIGRIQEVVAWTVHGETTKARIVLESFTDDELALVATACGLVAADATDVLGSRAVDGHPLGTGARRAI